MKKGRPTGGRADTNKWGGRGAADFLSLSFLRFWWRDDHHRRGGGNVKIPPRDFQGAVERVENLGLVFHPFHGLGISTALQLR